MTTPFPLSSFVKLISLFFLNFRKNAMLTEYMWRRFAVVKVRISKIREMRFYLTFDFAGFNVVNKRTMKDQFKISLIKCLLNLVTLVKLVHILKLGLRNISKKIKKSYTFKHLHSTSTCF